MTWRAIAISATAAALREGEGGGGASGDPSLASSPAEAGEDARVGVGQDKNNNKDSNKKGPARQAGSTDAVATFLTRRFGLAGGAPGLRGLLPTRSLTVCS